MNCNNDLKIYTGYHSYITSVKWSDFKSNVSAHLNTAMQINQDIF